LLFPLARVPLTPRDKVDRTRAAEIARAELGVASAADT